ncbi:interferon-induced, double-stranded RNA-activated protein kinase [Labrus mixtus]|uniref:interferon-induced, double-stranded RNA-activated protein kinase n=1 Tax=Labrus mixtus TaxID=508554 RepID=UPI0029C0A7BD|nr:interferon-induced, double-stranded RNA-activated protein kinase [Labrus mixtus]
MEAENYVAKLNEHVQRARCQLRYEDVGSVGPDHIKTFTVRAILNGKTYPDGVGKNKKEAKQNAAKNALRGVLEDQTEATEKTADVPASPIHQSGTSTVNFVSWLNEYGQRQRLQIRAVESTQVGANCALHFVVGDKAYPVATGKTKKEAKEEAAKLVYQEIRGSKTSETGDEKSSFASSQQEADVCDKTKSPSVKDFPETSVIGLLNNYCQKSKRFHDYVFERRCGLPNNPQFYYKVVIDKKEYLVGEGKSVKEAKQNAAQLAWSALQEQSDFDSQISPGSAVSEDSALASPSKPTSIEESSDAKSHSVQTASSDSFIVFADSPSPAQDQIQSPAVKPKIKIAANFKNALRQSKEDLVNFNGENQTNTPSEKSAKQSVASRFLSTFDFIDRLGKGGFGRVFKARQILLDKYYAVKVVRCKEKALREVAALSDLNHSNIVRYYTCWLEDSGYQGDSAADSSSSTQSTGSSASKFLYIQMELCYSSNLRMWIYEKNMQSVKKSLKDSHRREESLSIAKQIISGVEYFHSMKFIHRDLKPANIMFGNDGKVKIGDFGLVTDENDDDAENLMERTMCKGTHTYMAPEQRDRKTYDRKVDIFALGLIYFELLWNFSTGHERKEVWEDVRNQKPPQGFSHKFPLESQVIKSMLCVKPDERPEASRLKSDLEECSRILTALKESRCDNKTF